MWKGSRMYQPYPGSAEMSTSQRPPAPPAVRRAVVLMYAGAAVSLIRVVADVATRGELRAFVASRSQNSAVHLTASKISAAADVELVIAVAVGIISIGLWIFIARASRGGSTGARVTGTVLFGLDTLALLAGPMDVGIAGGQPALARVGTGAVWLLGLAVVVLLWQRRSSAFFRGGRELTG
jgi:hypothetical protein